MCRDCLMCFSRKELHNRHQVKHHGYTPSTCLSPEIILPTDSNSTIFHYGMGSRNPTFPLALYSRQPAQQDFGPPTRQGYHLSEPNGDFVCRPPIAPGLENRQEVRIADYNGHRAEEACVIDYNPSRDRHAQNNSIMEVSKSSGNAASRLTFGSASSETNSVQGNAIARSWSSSVRPNENHIISTFDFDVQAGDEAWSGLFRSPSRGYGPESPFSSFINNNFSTPLISSPVLSSFGLDTRKSRVSQFNQITRSKIEQAILISRVGFDFFLLP